MSRPIFSVLSALSVLLLASCDKVLKAGSKTERTGGSIADQVQIASESKPEIVTAFEAIANAAHEHNRVLLENIEGSGPVNGPAYSAGISHLERSARTQGGLAKRIIEAVSTTLNYEQGLFVPFDTIRRQVKGMETWSSDQATQRRGYIQIIDQQMLTYDQAIAHLERGEEPLLRQNFVKNGVPAEVIEEFLRLRRIWGKESGESERGMFREQQLSLQCYRDAMATNDPAKANESLAKARQHEQAATAFEQRMIAAIRKQMKDSGLP